ncbi:hypothetical protein niasHT_017590 [Heterodera trifolii]|uniref:Uncharacterized protein n=1 Tax=Heterodera trifolii TaxID=157864 RepID=A0ABD2KYV3_9BILA
MSDQQQSKIVGTVGAVCALGTVAVLLLLHVQRKKKQRQCNTEEYVRAGHVEQLYIYPMKSCRANKVSSSRSSSSSTVFTLGIDILTQF